MSVVYYVPTDDDELLVSTMAGRSKALAVARDPKVSLCVLDERWPFAYLQVYADATIEHDRNLVVDVMMAVGERMSGQPLGPTRVPSSKRWRAREARGHPMPAVRDVRPTPRHLHSNDQTEPLTHWISGSVPWDAPDS